MNLSIIIIGDEILLGGVTDTNSGLIARKFTADGWNVRRIRTVSDKADDIEAAIRESLAESELIITTGGLGPTRDDITKPVLARIFGGTITEDASVLENVKRIFDERGLELNELTRTQALVPDSCRVIQNRYGTAPLMWFEKDGRVLIAMPGVPFETRGMLDEVAREVYGRFGHGGCTSHREFTVCGICESALAERLAAFEDSLPANYKLAYLPNPGEIVMRLDADFSSCSDESSRFDEYASQFEEAVGEYLVGRGKLTPAELVLAKLRRHGYRIATAESCTGGNIAHLITSVAGCSDVMLGGVVSYCNEVKMKVLGVSGDTLARYGAVSEGTVRQMAEGVRRVMGADCAVATSGIAGPGGAVPGKPVGTVWIAAATPGDVKAECCHFRGDRQSVIDRASARALTMLADLL